MCLFSEVCYNTLSTHNRGRILVSTQPVTIKVPEPQDYIPQMLPIQSAPTSTHGVTFFRTRPFLDIIMRVWCRVTWTVIDHSEAHDFTDVSVSERWWDSDERGTLIRADATLYEHMTFTNYSEMYAWMHRHQTEIDEEFMRDAETD